MRKITLWLLALCCVLTACGASPTQSASGKTKIVTTIFPLYDWTRQIAGDAVELTMLLDSGADLHNYQPTVEDMARIAECDLFIYVGGESDKWVSDALKGISNPNRRVLNLMETFGGFGGSLREEELLPGMAPEEEDEDETAYDEHIWLSLRNASACCGMIAQTLEAMDVVTRAESGVDEYAAKLLALDAQYKEAVDAAPLKSVLFADRFPFPLPTITA